MLPLRSSIFSTLSIIILNSVGESGSPCFTPLSTLNSAVYALFTFTVASVFTRVFGPKHLQFLMVQVW
jgi:hypothetical protein